MSLVNHGLMAPIPDTKLAELILEQTASQVDLLFTLAVSVIGGTVALLFQVASNNHDEGKAPMPMVGKWIVTCAALSEMLSVFFGYCGRATLTAITPIIYKMDMGPVQNWSEAAFPGATAIKLHVAMQFVFFLFGIGMILTFVFTNRKSLKL